MSKNIAAFSKKPSVFSFVPVFPSFSRLSAFYFPLFGTQRTQSRKNRRCFLRASNRGVKRQTAKNQNCSHIFCTQETGRFAILSHGFFILTSLSRIVKGFSTYLSFIYSKKRARLAKNIHILHFIRSLFVGKFIFDSLFLPFIAVLRKSIIGVRSFGARHT